MRPAFWKACRAVGLARGDLTEHQHPPAACAGERWCPSNGGTAQQCAPSINVAFNNKCCVDTDCANSATSGLVCTTGTCQCGAGAHNQPRCTPSFWCGSMPRGKLAASAQRVPRAQRVLLMHVQASAGAQTLPASFLPASSARPPLPVPRPTATGAAWTPTATRPRACRATPQLASARAPEVSWRAPAPAAAADAPVSHLALITVPALPATPLPALLALTQTA